MMTDEQWLALKPLATSFEGGAQPRLRSLAEVVIQLTQRLEEETARANRLTGYLSDARCDAAAARAELDALRTPPAEGETRERIVNVLLKYSLNRPGYEDAYGCADMILAMLPAHAIAALLSTQGREEPRNTEMPEASSPHTVAANASGQGAGGQGDPPPASALRTPPAGEGAIEQQILQIIEAECIADEQGNVCGAADAADRILALLSTQGRETS